MDGMAGSLCHESHEGDSKSLVWSAEPMRSFWTAFEHEFDENELKRAQTRTILTKMRSK